MNIDDLLSSMLGELRKLKSQNTEVYEKQLQQLTNYQTTKDYLVVVQEEFVRDTQYAETPEASISEDEGWHNTTGEHVLGIFPGKTYGEAIEQASLICHCSSEILGAYQLANSKLLGVN